ncbi:hypothetical protein OEZ76_27825, partial [Leclercia adecarboxylata]|nr:hypothetical protein [Leclercia adecarboxylata]
MTFSLSLFRQRRMAYPHVAKQRRAASLYMVTQRMVSHGATRAVLALLAVFALVAPASAERIKDLAQVGGVRGNALVGYG